LTKTAGETALDDFMREGWLEKSRGGFISLTERALLELKEYLLQMFNDLEEEGTEEARVDRIRVCNACQEILTTVFVSHDHE
jgi:non-structural maintenance of chromosomes element 1